jgi:hypothetical protein
VAPDLLELLSYISIAVYCGVAFAAWRLHRRVRTERSLWLMATFSTSPTRTRGQR